jgi:hypothetical protein
MDSYLTWKGCDYVDVDNIYLGPEMYTVINDLGRCLNGTAWSYDRGLVMDSGLLPLSRIDNMLHCFIKRMLLPPVRLKKRGAKYEIVDGRHRIVMSIIFGYRYIPYNG